MPADDPNEKFMWVDEDDNELGAITRAEAHADNAKIHRAVYVLITHSDNKMLFQKRSQNKDLYPGYWAVGAAGHVSYGDSYEQTAERELKEELGLESKLYYVTKLYVQAEHESEVVKIFMARENELPKKFDKEEIDKLRWVDFEEIPAFVSMNEIPPADREVLRLLMYIK